MFTKRPPFILYFLIASLFSLPLTAKDNEKSSELPASTFYVGVGIGAELPLNGSYNATLIKRDPRADFKLEIGTSAFALPIHYSYGQNVTIVGAKPRFQFLFPVLSPRLLIGPGVGGVLNYWHSGFNVLGASLASNVVEVGAQGSLQAVIRPVGPFVIFITPIALDFNFYRKAWVSKDERRVGNFSTTNDGLGIIYSGSI